MSYLLDTMVVSALMRADPAPAKKLRALVPSVVGIPQPVIAEIQYGLMRMADSRKRRALVERLSVLCASIERLAWDDTVSEAVGEIKAALERRGERLEDFDLAIAAHALASSATLVTRNTKHFARVPGLDIEDWG